MRDACIQTAGASIQIAADVLVNSTERLVVVSGSVDAVVRAIFHISDVMIQVLNDVVVTSSVVCQFKYTCSRSEEDHIGGLGRQTRLNPCCLFHWLDIVT